MQRDLSIDILKFFAVIAITNSHMDVLYGEYSIMATGGAIGDALFFFASGYTLFLGQNRSFANYYKRRINRIYPTVFTWALISCLFLSRQDDFLTIILHGGGWFVSCIMIYYIILFFIQQWCLKYLKIILPSLVIISMGLYWLFTDGYNFDVYGNTSYYKWIHFFTCMLLGSIMGLRSQKQTVIVKKSWLILIKLFVCVVLFYGFYAFKTSVEYNFIQIFSYVPLLGVSYYMYLLCNTNKIKSIYYKKIGWIMRAIGGLCLEVYIVQSCLFTDKLNMIFPLNIVIIFIEIVFVAYIVRCLSRVWAQTFKEEDYDWKSIFKVV